MSNASKIIEALNRLDFKYDEFIEDLFDFGLDVVLKEIDEKEFVEELLNYYDDKIPNGIDLLITAGGIDALQDFIINFGMIKFQEWLGEGGLQKLKDKLFKKKTIIQPPTPIPNPYPLPPPFTNPVK